MVVGGGGREHAIIKKIKESKLVEKIYALPGNGGIAEDAECVAIGAKEIDKIVEFAVTNEIDYAIVAPDDPLVLGAVDALGGAPEFPGTCRILPNFRGGPVMSGGAAFAVAVPFLAAALA